MTDAYVLLTSMRKNLPEKRSSFEEKYVRQYHDLISSIESELSINLTPYRFDDSLLKYQVTSMTMGYSGHPWKTNYSEARYIDRSDFMIKLDALLMKFSIGWDDRKIGFSVN